MNMINKVGFTALVCYLASFMHFLGFILGLTGLVLTFVLYYLLDEEGYNTNFFKISFGQTIALIIPIGLVTYLGIDSYLNKGSNLVLIGTISFILLIIAAVLNYIQGQSMLEIANKTGSGWFRISGSVTKVGAITLPILFGLLILIVAQILFLIACITYKRNIIKL